MRTKLACILACCTVLFAFVAASAEETPEAAMLRSEIGAKVPATWQIRVAWREDQLVAFITPPYQEAFDLWYEPDKLRVKMLSLCPAKDDALWAPLGQGKQIAVEPTVGGKSDDSMRLTCPLGESPAL